MFNDYIVEEIREIRRGHAERFDFDLAAIYNDLKEKENMSGREVISLQPRRLPSVIEKEDAGE